MSYLQFSIAGYKFSPSLVGTLLMLCAIPLFIKFGFWQYNKAEKKQALQAMYEAALTQSAVPLPSEIEDVGSWRYRQVRVGGEYQADRQVLLDNQVAQDRAGYHVITPLRIAGSSHYILVDRGWVPAYADRSQLPAIETPDGIIEVEGHLWLPSEKFYHLDSGTSASTDQDWEVVWQNMDMVRYMDAVDFSVMPMVIRLDPKSDAGGYYREWPKPAERVTTHLGYAYQWFGFAVASVLIWLFVSFKPMDKSKNAV